MPSTKLQSSLSSWGRAGLLIFISAFLWSPSRDGLQIVYLLALFIPALFLLIINISTAKVFKDRSTAFALIFAAYSTVTCLWGVPSDCLYFMGQWLVLAVWLYGSLYLISNSEINLRLCLDWFIALGMLLVVVSVAYHYYNNSSYSNNRLSGINSFRNPNEMGALSGIISLLSFTRALISNSSRVAILFYTCSLVSAAALIISFSRGALLALSVSLILSLIVFRPKAKTYVWVFIIFVTIIIFILGKFNYEALMLRGNLENLGGRLPIWKEVVERTKSHVFFGIGLSKDNSIIMGNTFFNHAHNAWLDTFFRTGLVGLILLALHLLEVLRRCSKDPFVLISAVWLTYGCIFNIFDGQILFGKLGAKWFFYWIPAGILVGLSYKNSSLGKVKYGS